MNEYDSNRILDLAKTIGYTATNNLSQADCYVLNTCHIREKATDKVYHDIGRLKKEFRNKGKPMVLVTGCVAQAENEEMLNREKYIDGVVGPQSYHQIPEIIKKIESKKNKINNTEFNVIEKFDTLNLIKNSNSKISSFLTIQEGCDKFCHFCVVPYTRGPEFSRSFNEIINEAKQLVENGSKEITLLGQNVNAYEYKDQTNSFRLSDLIFKLNEIKEFNKTLELIKEVEFINSYSFIYSSRPGTPASELGNVDAAVAKKRLIKLQTLLETNNSKYKNFFLNKSIEVLFENKLNKQNKYFGRDKFLNSVIVESEQDLTGQLLEVKINNFNHNSLFGVVLSNKKINFAA